MSSAKRKKTQRHVKQVKRRTFTGCETCRNRKVKCDGQRPNCLRCEKSKLICLGYDIKLKFTETLTILKNKKMGNVITEPDSIGVQQSFQRRLIPFMKFPPISTYKYFEDIDPVLDTVDNVSNKDLPFFKGPFGCIQMNGFNMLRQNNSQEFNTQQQQQQLQQLQQQLQENQNSKGNHNESKGNNSTFNTMMVQPAIAKHGNVTKDLEKLQKDELIPRHIWIHPKIQIDALLTYKTIVGDADANNQNWNQIQETIFPEFYGKPFKNRIMDRCKIPRYQLVNMVRKRSLELLEAMDDEHKNLPVDELTIKMVINSSTTQDLIRTFVKTCTSMMYLNFKGNVFETVVIPLLYKNVGQVYLFNSFVSMGTNGDASTAEDYFNMDDNKFEDFCRLIKQTFVITALSIASLNQYRVLFNDFGLCEGSTLYLRCYISFREISIMNLAQIIEIVIRKYTDDSPIKLGNSKVIYKLVSAGIIKEFLLCLILAIKQDEVLNVLHNFNVLFNVTNQVCKHIKSLKCEDKQLDELLLWFRYMLFFFRSTSKIDVLNYKLDEDKELYADINSNYNLIEKFDFNDSFKPNEFNKIEIRPGKVNRDEGQDDDDNDDDDDDDYDYDYDDNYDDDDDDDDDDDYDSDDNQNGDKSTQQYIREKVNIPKRLANRPSVPDRPPMSFTVQFHFNNNEDESEENESDDELDDDYDDENDVGDKVNEKMSLENENQSNGLQERERERERERSHIHNLDEQYGDNYSDNSSSTRQDRYHMREENHKLNDETIDPLTGLSSHPSEIPFVNREQLYSDKNNLIDILTSFSENSNQVVLPTEVGYGIPLSLLELMEKTVRISDHRNWFLRNKMNPRNFPKVCCDLEEELINWKLPWNLFSKDKSSINGTNKFNGELHEILYHLTICFYNSILLYFFRLIKDTDPSLLQNHVLTVLTHLEQLRQISFETNGPIRISPPFWCFFISGSDSIGSNSQSRFENLSKSCFDIGDKWIGRQMMMEIWRGRNYGVNVVKKNVLNKRGDNIEQDKEASWLDMIKGWEVSGFH